MSVDVTRLKCQLSIDPLSTTAPSHHDMRLAKFLIAAAVFGSHAVASVAADGSAVADAASASASTADMPVPDTESVETFHYEVRTPIGRYIALCMSHID